MLAAGEKQRYLSGTSGEFLGGDLWRQTVISVEDPVEQGSCRLDRSVVVVWIGNSRGHCQQVENGHGLAAGQDIAAAVEVGERAVFRENIADGSLRREQSTVEKDHCGSGCNRL